MPELSINYIQTESAYHEDSLAKIVANLSYYAGCTRDVNDMHAALATLNKELAKLNKEIQAIDDENNNADTLTILKLNLNTQIEKFLTAKQSELQVEHIQETVARLRDDLLATADPLYAESKLLALETIKAASSANDDAEKEEVKTAEIHSDPLTGRLIPVVDIAPRQPVEVDVLKQLQQQYKKQLVKVLEKHRPNVEYEEKRITIVQDYLRGILLGWVKVNVNNSQNPKAISDELNTILNNINNCNDEKKYKYFPGKLESTYVMGKHTLDKLGDLIKVLYPYEKYKTLEAFFKAISGFYNSSVPAKLSVFTLENFDNRLLTRYLPNRELFLELPKEKFVDPLNINGTRSEPLAKQIFPLIKDVTLQNSLAADYVNFVRKFEDASVVIKSDVLPEPAVMVRSSFTRRKSKSNIELVVDELCENPISDIAERRSWISSNRQRLYVNTSTWEILLELIHMVFAKHEKIEVTNKKIQEAQETTTVLDFFKKLHSFLKVIPPIAVDALNVQQKPTITRKVLDLLHINSSSSKTSAEKVPEVASAYRESPLIIEKIKTIVEVLPVSAQLTRLVSDPRGEEQEKQNEKKLIIDDFITKKATLENEIREKQKTFVTNVDEPLLKLLRTHALHAFQQTLYPAKAYTEPKIFSTLYNNIMHWFHHSPGWFTNTGGQKPIFKMMRDLFNPELKEFSVAAEMLKKFLRRHKGPESGLHTDSFDTFFLQLLYNTGTPKGLFKLNLTTAEIENIKKLPDVPKELSADDAELRRFMLTELPKVEFTGTHKYYLRGINCQSTRNRSKIRSEAISNFTKLGKRLSESGLTLMEYYHIEPLPNEAAPVTANDSNHSPATNVSLRN